MFKDAGTPFPRKRFSHCSELSARPFQPTGSTTSRKRCGRGSSTFNDGESSRSVFYGKVRQPRSGYGSVFPSRKWKRRSWRIFTLRTGPRMEPQRNGLSGPTACPPGSGSDGKGSPTMKRSLSCRSGSRWATTGWRWNCPAGPPKRFLFPLPVRPSPRRIRKTAEPGASFSRYMRPILNEAGAAETFPTWRRFPSGLPMGEEIWWGRFPCSPRFSTRRSTPARTLH